MDVMTQVSFTQVSLPHPGLRRAAIAAHVLLAAWLLINGVAHEIGVVVKAQAGTLSPHAGVPGLLAVGAGLIVAGAAIGWSALPLARSAAPSPLPAFLGAGLLAAVLGGIGLAYGPRFLGGSIALAVVDVALLAAHAALNGRA
jgi:hypothetical protein